jgi:hypothetical protein
VVTGFIIGLVILCLTTRGLNLEFQNVISFGHELTLIFMSKLLNQAPKQSTYS